MGDMLSQAEVDALLGGGSLNDTSADSNGDVLYETEPGEVPAIDAFTTEQQDILGEIGNISMGTSATTLFALLGKKVLITTPQVTVRTWGDLINSYDRPCVGTRIDTKKAL